MPKPVVFRITNNLKIGGVQRRLRGVLPRLTDRFEVHVATYRRKGVFFDELRDLGVRTHFVPLSGKWDPVGIVRLARLLRRHRADIVHTHSLGANIAGILAAGLARVPVRIAQVHHRGNHWYAPTPFGRRKQALQETLIHRRLTDRVLFVSQESLDYFARTTGLPPAMLALLHNGLDLDGLAPTRTRDAVLEEYGVSPEATVVGFVGRLVEGKGLDFLLSFAAKAARERPETVFLVVGGNPAHVAEVREEIGRRGLEGTVIMAGEQQDVGSFYQTFDCFFFPSEAQWEGMPGVVLEACNAGLPVLARESEPVREIVPYYPRIHFMADADDPATALDTALALPPADAAPLRGHFSMDAMAQRTTALYESLLQEKGLG